MKHTKKIVCLLLVMAMMFSLSVTAFAVEGTNDNNGKITIDNAVVGQTYTLYQILVLESYNTATDSYSYKAADGWADWLATQKTYVTIDDQGYVTWVKDADAAEFAKAAQEHAATLSTNQGSEKAETTTVEFTGLNLGYYLVDSTLGTVCSLDTTNPEVIIKEKSGVPTNEKKVEEDSDNQYGETNDADFTQTVNFKSTIVAQAGAQNYVFHDKMSAGLTFGSVTGITLNGNAVAAENYTVKTTDLTDDCTFEVVFKQDFCDTLKANDEIVISYTATLNKNAVVGLKGNPNESKLEYGEQVNDGHGTFTPESETTTYTWDMEVLKYANDDEKAPLADAEFVLLNKDKTKVATFDGGKFNGWVDVPSDEKTWDDASKLTTGDDGKIHIDGLDADTYYLREIKAPAGFNILSEDEEAVIKGATAGEDDQLTYETLVVKINNNSGTELPSTGGRGTEIFYIVGAVLVLGAAVLLITRKRMAARG